MNLNLYKIKGSVEENAPIGAQSWFACGGTADALFQPADDADLSRFLLQNPKVALTIIGGLANTIVRDGGVRGVTVQLSKAMANVESRGDTYIRAQAGALNGTVAARAVKAGIGGLEFLSGIPGSVGGAVAMNAGAYGTEVKDVLIGVEGLDRQGNAVRLPREALNMTYRHTDLPHGFIVTAAIFKGMQEDYDTVKERMNEIKARRNDTQPIREKTGGSTFANPNILELRRAGLPEDMRAWQVVEAVDGRGLYMGGAKMSEKHCNFMVNTGNATAADLEGLGEELRKRAMHKFGLPLKWEIKRIGEAL